MRALARFRHGRPGFTAVELIIVTGIMSVVFIFIAIGWKQLNTVLVMNRARASMETQTTNAFVNLSHFLSKAAWNTVIISSSPGLPWSRIQFSIQNENGTLVTYTVAQTANKAITIQETGKTARVIVDHVSSLIFTYPRADDPSRLQISIRENSAVDALHAININRNVNVTLSAPRY